MAKPEKTTTKVDTPIAAFTRGGNTRGTATSPVTAVTVNQNRRPFGNKNR